MLVERSIVNPATTEQAEHSFALRRLLMEPGLERTQFLLTALPLVVLHREPLSQPLQDLARVPQECFDVRPDKLFNVIASKSFGWTLLAIDTVKPSCELPPVASIVPLLPGRLRRS